VNIYATTASRLKACIALSAAALALGACAGSMPVPGGSKSINKSCFSSVADMQARVASLTPGMPEGRVLTALCRKKENMARLERREIRIALLGGENVPFSNMDQNSDTELIRSLYGYKVAYKVTKRKHGFVNPIRIQTNEMGFNYTVTLIFRDGTLFEKPILSGGSVNETSSGTLFDYLTPGTIVNAATP
jgi:hypothetical protein